MSRGRKLKELFDKEATIQPYAEKDGKKYVSFEDASILNNIAMEDGDKGTGMQTRNPDGTLASTGKRVHAVNPDYFFCNRYKLKGNTASRRLWVVSGHEPTGFRCIQEQEKGRIFIKTIPCYVLMRDEKGELAVEKKTTISDTEFISDFTSTLDHKSMAEVLKVVTAYGTDMTASELPI